LLKHKHCMCQTLYHVYSVLHEDDTVVNYISAARIW